MVLSNFHLIHAGCREDLDELGRIQAPACPLDSLERTAQFQSLRIQDNSCKFVHGPPGFATFESYGKACDPGRCLELKIPISFLL